VFIEHKSPASFSETFSDPKKQNKHNYQNA